MDSYPDAFAVLMNVERGFQNNPLDPGNWTGGRVGVGSCRGTKYGISAASYPDLDIAKLTLEQAQSLAKAKYWDKYHCDEYDIRVAFQVFDAAYNGGHPAQWLQQAVGVRPDGDIGPATIAAVKAADPRRVVLLFDAARLDYLADINNPTFADGWMRRIASNLRAGAA
ncbi:glycoside hydrolase family 108 protein [Paraburkholderia phenazinium]|uniref:Predicted Peptidoglycan domain-containing protein n=1 Tax=Paraburkholderia phenazinium TaxID=60549 RepID=A0A1N6KPY5_9BURK|nr:glycosyl hydrolase 108 family protein [Paraburkholderia phenazinium]SIO58436.1 Predicted Peptidoglycan domain-containing protein [Paraburkholderia phenazinium]